MDSKQSVQTFLSRHPVVKGRFGACNQRDMSCHWLVLAMKLIKIENPLKRSVRIAYVRLLA